MKLKRLGKISEMSKIFFFNNLKLRGDNIETETIFYLTLVLRVRVQVSAILQAYQ